MLLIPIALALGVLPTLPPNGGEALLPPLNVAPLTNVAQAAGADGSEASLLSYTYVEVGATWLTVDAFDETSDIYYGRASIGLFGFLYVFGEYQNQSSDFQNTDTNALALGAGAHLALMPKLDIYGEASYLYADVSSDLATLDDSNQGYELAAGARFMLLPWSKGGLEINGQVNYVDLENRFANDDGQVGWEVGARLHFLRLLSIGASYAEIDDDDQSSINLRVSF